MKVVCHQFFLIDDEGFAHLRFRILPCPRASHVHLLSPKLTPVGAPEIGNGRDRPQDRGTAQKQPAPPGEVCGDYANEYSRVVDLNLDPALCCNGHPS